MKILAGWNNDKLLLMVCMDEMRSGNFEILGEMFHDSGKTFA